MSVTFQANRIDVYSYYKGAGEASLMMEIEGGWETKVTIMDSMMMLLSSKSSRIGRLIYIKSVMWGSNRSDFAWSVRRLDTYVPAEEVGGRVELAAGREDAFNDAVKLANDAYEAALSAPAN